MTPIGEEECVVATTFKRDGTGVPTTVWLVPYGENKIAFWSAANVGKTKRLSRDPRVVLQPSDFYGNVKEGSVSIQGTAVLHHGEKSDEIAELLRAKYNGDFDAMVESAGEYIAETVGVVVTLNDPSRPAAPTD